MSNPTRFPSGLSTEPVGNLTADYPFPSPFNTGSVSGRGVASYFSDFFKKDSGISVTGTSSTFAITDGLGGIGVLTPGGTTTASAAFLTNAGFQFVAGYRMWFQTKLTFSAVGTGITGSTGWIKSSSGTPATTDSLLFKVAATGVVSLVSTVGSTATTLVSSVTTLVGGTYVELGLYYNGTDILVYVNGVVNARVTAPTIGSSSTTLTNAVMTPYFQITPAATETISVDYLLSAQEVTGR